MRSFAGLLTIALMAANYVVANPITAENMERDIAEINDEVADGGDWGEVFEVRNADDLDTADLGDFDDEGIEVNVTLAAREVVPAHLLESRVTCGQKIVNAGLSQKGLPYVYGGGSCTGKTGGGFDCSGLTRFAVHKAKPSLCLAHSAQTQYLDTKHGKRIALSKRAAGDLVFWNHGGSCSKGVSHTAIVKDKKTLVVARYTGTKIGTQAYWTNYGGMKICPYAMRFC